ncbi:MAG: triose-phosphate isomerase [Myxococcales bacterium]|nr:triose-phosphate isomerase [Polyangiaceae bacterium]MDW8248649.1 triose-phosphate isomerase [Myxococcales bacterium]
MNAQRRPLIAGNWKMFHGGPGACDLAAQIAAGVEDLDHIDVVICPPFTALAAVAAELEGRKVQLGAQNLHPQASGAFTGEVSGPMLVECGARWVIVGHSERRHQYGEGDDLVAAKTKAALDVGLRPIICVGETLAERTGGQTLAVVQHQLEAVMPMLERSQGQAVVAYEPVWAIGTGHNATTAQAQEVHAMIRAQLRQLSSQLAERTRILYGGSVKPDNAAALLSCPDVDGALVGGASLDPHQFLAIARAAQPA